MHAGALAPGDALRACLCGITLFYMEWRARGVVKCPVIVSGAEVLVFIQDSFPKILVKPACALPCARFATPNPTERKSNGY